MTRIIAGRYGGLRLVTPKGDATRPTSDRVREALFSSLEHAGLLGGARVLDLFAGSGALGLEALSRGAASVTLVDKSQPAVAACRANARLVAGSADGRDGAGPVTVVKAAVSAFLDRPDAGPFDVVFADPPYPLAEGEVGEVLARLAGGPREDGSAGNGPRLAEGAVVVVERSARSPEPGWPASMVRFREKTHGETRLWWAEYRGISA